MSTLSGIRSVRRKRKERYERGVCFVCQKEKEEFRRFNVKCESCAEIDRVNHKKRVKKRG